MYFILKFNLTFFSKFEETWELVFNFLNEIISKAIQNFASVISFLFFNRIVRSRLPSRVRSQSKLIGLFFMRRDSKVLTAAIFKVGSDFYRVWLLSLFSSSTSSSTGVDRRMNDSKAPLDIRRRRRRGPLRRRWRWLFCPVFLFFCSSVWLISEGCWNSEIPPASASFPIEYATTNGCNGGRWFAATARTLILIFIFFRVPPYLSLSLSLSLFCDLWLFIERPSISGPVPVPFHEWVIRLVDGIDGHWIALICSMRPLFFLKIFKCFFCPFKKSIVVFRRRPWSIAIFDSLIMFYFSLNDPALWGCFASQ